MSAIFEGDAMSAMQKSHCHTSLNNYSPQELALEIKAFISGVDQTQGRKLSVRDHARCAVRLLRTVPACRGAVLEHLRGVYDEYVASFLQDLEAEVENGGTSTSGGGSTSVSSLEDVIKEVHAVLSEFIKLSPKAWAPLVSTWAVDLLGQLSSKHAGRRAAPHSSSLNELLQLWMSCAATRSLMECYSQCLAAMLAWCPDACVDALLDTSVQHSPHFDWVVAHIGSAFPGTIISRVLACGLKDFYAHGYSSAEKVSQQQAIDKSCRVPKIGSVVGILGHLASRHSDSIKKELLRMFQDSLSPPPQNVPPHSSGAGGWENSPHLRRATVPFLLQLAALSPTLLGAVSAELVEFLRPPVLVQLQAQFQALPREEVENMLGLAVHLISQSPSGGARVLKFLADTATPSSVIISGPTPSPHDSIREACDRLLQTLLLHLHKLVHNRPEGDEPFPQSSAASAMPQVIPFLEELQGHIGDLCAETLRLERKRHLWLHQLLYLLSVYGGPSVATEALCQLFTQARNPEELALASQLYTPLSTSLSGLLPSTVARCVAQIHTQTLDNKQLAQLLNNLATAVQSQEEDRKNGGATMGSSAQSSMAAQVRVAVSSHLQDFCPLLLHGDKMVSKAAVRLLSCSQLPRACSPAHLLLICRAAVSHFFVCLRLQGESLKVGEEEVGYSMRLLSRLAAYCPLTLKAVLQQLVEGALHKGNRDLFGGLQENPSDDITQSANLVPDLGISLLDVNCKFGTSVNFSGNVWSVFHAGVIGKGLKPPYTPSQPDPDRINQNMQTLLAVMVQCCSSGGGSPTGNGRNGSAVGTSNGSFSASEPLISNELPPINAEAAKVIAVTLVENICPDVANGELSWPPEEHAKTTVERDIHIRRCFENNPVLFHLLRVVAAGRPALCYCSVILRGLLSTLLAHWEASREPSVSDSPWHLQTSCLLVSCMGEGQLLPPVLSNIHEVLPHLSPFEVRLLLLGVWEYMRGNSPMPQKFTFCADQGLFFRDFSRDGDVARYIAPIHSVLHKNIDRLGHLCWRFQV
ncbi:integrator complex subunit 5 [Ctenopharyngodon idella]|uniref:integrator complex subunit 5 n=1 Tax=Ctenopharyngodon idella TaxID=7959 RepID=UPI002231D615|nr:integrator complex subunit 5 [Ctenopharyngodon idella]XP_051716961.1 integrator complex subunit 5 [Ctenopharyngodon idella]